MAISSIDPGWERVGYEAAGMVDRILRGECKQGERVEVVPGVLISRRSSEHFAISDPSVRKAVDLIQAEACGDLTVEGVVRASGVSRRTLERRFRQVFGRGIDTEIRRQRLAVAETFLRTSAKRVSEISELAGFSSLYHFSNAFKKRHGVSPNAYRKARQSD